MIQEAIDCYHGLLTDESAAQMHGVMLERLKSRKLFFGSAPICRVLRPHFYFKNQWDYLKARSEIVLRAFAKAHDACMENATLREQLGLEPYEEEMLVVDQEAKIKVPWSSSRLDSFYHPETGYLKFVEYNAETPAGIGYGDELADMFLELHVMQEFQKHYHVHIERGMKLLTNALQRAYREWGGQGIPQIAIADWRDVPTLNEHEISKAFFEQQGHKAILADPRDMEYRNGKLWAGDFRIDMIYKRVLFSELIQRMGLESPVVRAVRDRAVFITNSASAKMLAKKASLAFLSDEANAHLFTAEELDAIHQHIPWTRRVTDRKTLYQSKEVDLMEFIVDHRENLVLKPNDEYGGKGVVIGWQTSTDEWNETMQHALTTPFVVQERVQLIQRDFPMVMNDKLDISPRYVDADPYVYYGESVGGCLTRLSGAALLNVTAGVGSVVPMFVIEKR
jgi:uncharacterized circularly permuted ATP-grasp superfamily protein